MCYRSEMYFYMYIFITYITFINSPCTLPKKHIAESIETANIA
uniref:Uncharacterized protein n=1 Tax=Anguilla anguilla TaxID=7936 RepID=A0A0E9V3M5_ANGAN